MSLLPTIQNAFQSLSYEEFKEIENNYFSSSSSSNSVNFQLKFNYSFALIKSTQKTDQKKGVNLLREIYLDVPQKRKECLYYLGLGEFKLGNLKEAKNYISTLLEKEPLNLQVKELFDEIELKLNNEGLIGIAIVTSVVASVGLLLGLIFKKK